MWYYQDGTEEEVVVMKDFMDGIRDTFRFVE